MIQFNTHIIQPAIRFSRKFQSEHKVDAKAASISYLNFCHIIQMFTATYSDVWHCLHSDLPEFFPHYWQQIVHHIKKNLQHFAFSDLAKWQNWSFCFSSSSLWFTCKSNILEGLLYSALKRILKFMELVMDLYVDQSTISEEIECGGIRHSRTLWKF